MREEKCYLFNCAYYQQTRVQWPPREECREVDQIMPEYDNCCLSRFTAAFTPIIVLLWPGFVRAGLTPCYQVSTSTQNIGQQLVRMSPSSLSLPPSGFD